MQLNNNAGTTATTYTRLEYRQWIMAPRIYRVQIQGSLEDPFWGGRSKYRPGRIGPVESESRPPGRLTQQLSSNLTPLQAPGGGKEKPPAGAGGSRRHRLIRTSPLHPNALLAHQRAFRS